MLNTPIRRFFVGNLSPRKHSRGDQHAGMSLAGLKFMLLAGLIASTAVSAWGQLPPPVQLPLQNGESIVSSETYVDGVPQNAELADYWAGPPGFHTPGQVPHVIIQAPTPPTVTRGHATVTRTHDSVSSSHSVYPSQAYQQHNPAPSSGSLHPHLHHAHQKTAAAVAPLTHPPGVENDPSAKGPGRLGLGEHWVKNPQARPTIPAATVQPRWKTPYSYGYFGAEGKRHWSRQHGYNDRSLQWSLR